MPQRTVREFSCGEWWLEKRTASYYGIRYDAAKRYNERRSLGTDEFENAKELLTHSGSGHAPKVRTAASLSSRTFFAAITRTMRNICEAPVQREMP
jgi:hypothetical protein